MKRSGATKSSFSLPPREVALVNTIKRRLRLASNTAVVRYALVDLRKKLDREELRQQLRTASHLVRKANREEMRELDMLSDEGLGGN